jgi:hypothetical protein
MRCVIAVTISCVYVLSDNVKYPGKEHSSRLLKKKKKKKHKERDRTKEKKLVDHNAEKHRSSREVSTVYIMLYGFDLLNVVAYVGYLYNKNCLHNLKKKYIYIYVQLCDKKLLNIPFHLRNHLGDFNLK